MTQNLNKITKALALAASDTREDTLKSIILNSLYECETFVDFRELCESINIIYDIKPFDAELTKIIQLLCDEGVIERNNDKFCLSETEKIKFKELDLRNKEVTKRRFENFERFVKENVNKALDETSLRKLWESFSAYLYNCFYDYGEKATAFILKNKKEDEFNSNRLNEALNTLTSDELKGDFKKVVSKFSEHLTSDDLDYIYKLGQKTLSFASLGIEPELASEFESKSMVDWTVYLDTNFLFSLLDLHVHPEDQACKELVRLVKEHNIKIKFCYSDITAIELKQKKKDFDNLKKLPKTAIAAMLRSSKLDEYSQRYYSSLINNPAGAIHPSEIINLAPAVLANMGIKITQNKLRIDTLGESYLGTRIQDYLNWIIKKNEIRQQHAKNIGVEISTRTKSDKQANHDITLREIILHQRPNVDDSSSITLNKVKFFAITLDELLINYDQSESRRKVNKNYPVFFKPSYLLVRLVKTLPIQAENYKKAFVKAVTARGFNSDISRTKDIIAIVEYLRSQGIENEDVIYNLISEEIFLEKYNEESKNDSFDQSGFIDSELNRLFEKTQNEINRYKAEIIELQKKAEDESSFNEQLLTQKNEISTNIEKISTEKKSLEEQTENLEKVVKHLSKKISKYEKTKPVLNPIIDFEGAKKVAQLENKVNRLLEEKRAKYVNNEIKSWRKKSWKWLFIAVVGGLVVLGAVWLFYKPDSLDSAINQVNSNSSLKKIILIVGGLIWFIIDGFIIKVIYSKYHDHANIESFKRSIELPEELIPPRDI